LARSTQQKAVASYSRQPKYITAVSLQRENALSLSRPPTVSGNPMQPTRQRQTRQRDAIRAALQAADRPLGPQEILAAVRRELPGLGIATVYRTVNCLLQDGWLRPVELPGAPARYEIAGKGHHHHFHCRSCDGVFEVEACPGGIRGLIPGGFRLEHHEIILYGLCDTCGATG
jgi:Fur family ferric uptake transcriptional regulator